MKRNAFYAQSGGVTAVINASACGLIETARKYSDKIGKVYAGRNASSVRLLKILSIPARSLRLIFVA